MEDGHFIDDPLMVVNVKPDFEGLGIEPIHQECMTDENKKKIYNAARKVCETAVCGWDAEIDEDNFEEIVDEELIVVIEEIIKN